MKAILSRLFNHEELTREEAKNLLLNITKGRYNDSQIAALLTVFQMRGIKVEELIGFREALLTTRVPIDFSAYKPIDIVGTGGDGKNTFNISTCACFIVAGAGYHVAKHGNYGATSISGASNVMEQHGVKFTNDPSILTRSMEECGMVYMHAQLFNPAMKSVGPVRKASGRYAKPYKCGLSSIFSGHWSILACPLTNCWVWQTFPKCAFTPTYFKSSVSVLP